MLEDPYEFQPQRKPGLTLVSLFIWLGIVAAFGMLIVGLSGCAQATFSGVCAFKPIGNDEHGNIVAITYCQARE